MKMLTSQVMQVTWLIDQLINPNNLHVSRNLSILFVVLVQLEEKTKLTNYWPVYRLVDDVTTTLYHSHITVSTITMCLCTFIFKIFPRNVGFPLISQTKALNC